MNKIDLSEINKSELYSIIAEKNPSDCGINLNAHLEAWSTAKYELYKLFGGSLKIEKQIESCISNLEMENIVNNFCRYVCGNNPQLLPVRMLLTSSVISLPEIRTNTLKDDINFLGTIFKKGMKISRILPKIVLNNWSEYVQIEYSKVLQQIKVQGRAVLSIDPKDFLTMSQSKNWRSCQSLDGEYRTATLAYMMDYSTVVAYVTTETETNNKAWRQLVYFDAHSESRCAIQSRQYPSVNLNNEKTIAAMILDLFGPEYRAIEESVDTVADRDIVIDCDSHYSDDANMWYNDLRKRTFSDCTVILPNECEDVYALKNSIYVGVDVISCACGCGYTLDDPDSLFQESCRETVSEDYEYDEEYA